MCGIAGFLNSNGYNKDDNINLLKKMVNVIKHRGPDEQSYYVNDICGLGFCRLSIIDLQKGKQPFFNEDKTVVVIGNGEIFGYKEIRNELIKKNHHFDTECDIEVLVHLYEEEGINFFKKLRGQFAFVIVDIKKHRFYLVRDQFGVCPLFYTQKAGNVIFGSEIKAILEYPEIDRKINIEALDQFFTLPGLANPNSIFKNIFSVAPGHFIEVDSNGNFTDNEYWDVTFPQDDPDNYITDPEEVRYNIEKLLVESVNKCLIHSDVEVGALLSGGLDSSLINAILKELSPEVRRTFSVVLGSNKYDESNYQSQVTEYTGFKNEKILFQTDDIIDNLKNIIYYCECPIKESVNVALYKLSSTIRKNNLKVVLSGEGADEIFAGYLGYLGDIAFGNSRDRDIEEMKICKKLFDDEMFKYDVDYKENELTKKLILTPNAYDLTIKNDFKEKGIINLEKIKGVHPINRRSYLDIKLRLPELLLMNQHDHMFAANSVEARYPFLNVDLVKYAAKMHPNFKIKGAKQKYILREIAKTKLPKTIVKRSKFPFVTPSSPDVLKANEKFIRDILSEDTIKRQGIFNYDEINNMINMYLKNDTQFHINFNSDVLMQIISFTLLVDKFNIELG